MATVTHEKGTVMLLDFWATWCPPCQKPMAHNQEMLTNNASDWGSKVRIVGLSIDADTSTVKKHVEAKGWEKVEHYQCGEDSTVKKDFCVSGVPSVALVDSEGKIVFIGHPSECDLEASINTLLKGEKLEDKKES